MKKGALKKKVANQRQTGNKTVQQPRTSLNREAAKGGLSDAGMKRGYDVKGKLPVLSSPHQSVNKTA
jgi:hypothetical protein